MKTKEQEIKEIQKQLEEANISHLIDAETVLNNRAIIRNRSRDHIKVVDTDKEEYNTIVGKFLDTI